MTLPWLPVTRQHMAEERGDLPASIGSLFCRRLLCADRYRQRCTLRGNRQHRRQRPTSNFSATQPSSGLAPREADYLMAISPKERESPPTSRNEPYVLRINLGAW